jgi:peroxin-1
MPAETCVCLCSVYKAAKLTEMQILSKIVQAHIRESDLVLDPEQAVNFTALATQTEGYLANDLKDLVAHAVHKAAMRVAEHEDEEDFQVRFNL